MSMVFATAEQTIPTSCSRVLDKLFVSQLVKKFPTFYGTLHFIMVFTRACQ